MILEKQPPPAIQCLEPRVLLARPDPSPADNVYFRLPLSSDTTVHYYFDRNGSAPGVEVWNGTNQSYDGHTGTDYSGGPRGRPVFASAPGILIGKDDGHPDFGGPPNGNYVRINHGNDRLGRSIRTVYLHFEAGTVTSKAIGSFIAAGEQIGGVGTSGNSTGLHLHLHTMVGGVAFDPYKKINSSEISWWTNQGSGAPSTTAQPNKFVVGDTAEVYELSGTQLNVRATPAGTSVGTRPNGATGTVLEGPVWAAFNGDIANSLWVWYRVRWSDGLEGWSTHNWLRKAVDLIPPTVTSSALQFETAPMHLTVGFSENVGPSVSSSDFVLTNLDTGGTYSLSAQYNQSTNVATVSFGGMLPDGNYRLRVIGSGISDAAGNPMSGDHLLDFFVFSGDANRDRVVNIGDFSILAARFNQAGTFSQGDFNYDAVVNISDFSILASKFNQGLAEPAGLARAGPPAENVARIDPPVTPRSSIFSDLWLDDAGASGVL